LEQQTIGKMKGLSVNRTPVMRPTPSPGAPERPKAQLALHLKGHRDVCRDVDLTQREWGNWLMPGWYSNRIAIAQ